MKSEAAGDVPLHTLPATASEWALRLSEGELTPSERHAFAQWLAGGNDRLRQVKEAQAVLRISGALRDSESARLHLNQSLPALGAGITAATPPLFSRRRALVAGAASLAAGAAFLTMFQPRSGPPPLDNNAKVATAVGAIERFNLSDRSALTLGASSAVQMAFTDEQREISLHKGKAFFEVVHRDARPFVVKAGSHQVVVTGTMFNASYNQAKDQLEVAVVEGSVNVGAANRPSAAERLDIGDVTLFQSGTPRVSRKITADQAAAWRTGVLYFDDATLDDLVLDINGYLPKPLVVESANLSHLTLTAQLPAGDTQAAIVVLREVLGLEVRELPDRWELSKAEADTER